MRREHIKTEKHNWIMNSGRENRWRSRDRKNRRDMSRRREKCREEQGSSRVKKEQATVH